MAISKRFSSLISRTLPDPLHRKVRDIERLIADRRIQAIPKTAVFDLDDTLLEGDIGDAVFAQLKRDESRRYLTVQQKPLPLDWREYRNLIETGKKQEAYLRVVTCMAGVPLDVLSETTRKILRSPHRYIEIEGETVPIPRINPTMFGLIQLLRKLKYRIMVISASNHFSVRLVAGELLQIPRSQAFGIRPLLKYIKPEPTQERIAVLTGILQKPIPWARGKAEVYARHAGQVPPLITGGDSETDIFLLNLSHPLGLAIWAGKDQNRIKSLQKKLDHPCNLYPLYPE
ncbi:MAG: HAD family hydrolase [Candidatus Aminicenantes bacterium]|nr:HAD family hydrolase [Candidatus Aminicenantes bacterium]